MSDDLEIVRRVQRGETQGFALLVERYHRHLLNCIFRLVRDESVVEDIGQEVFLPVVDVDDLAAPSSGSPEDLAIGAEEQQAVSAALALLPEPDRRALIASLRGDAAEEQALAEKIGSGTVKDSVRSASSSAGCALPCISPPPCWRRGPD